MNPMIICYNCKKALEAPLPVSRSLECPQCGRDVRVCKNCKHYSKNASGECKETIQEFVSDKERRNFCDYFSPILGQGQEKNTENNNNKAQDARARLNQLFRDMPSE